MKNIFGGSVLFNIFISPWTFEYDIQALNIFTANDKLDPQQIFLVYFQHNLHRAAVWFHLDWHFWGQSQHTPEAHKYSFHEPSWQY